MVCVLEQGWNKILQGCGPPETEFDVFDVLSILKTYRSSCQTYLNMLLSIENEKTILCVNKEWYFERYFVNCFYKDTLYNLI